MAVNFVSSKKSVIFALHFMEKIMDCKILHNKRGLIFGAVDERSIAWHVAQKCLAAGAQIVLTNTETAIELGNVRQLAEANQISVIACDATSVEDLQHLFEETQRLLGGKLDFVLHAVAMSENLRRHREYDDVNYNYFLRTIDVSALSLHKLLQTAKKMDAIAEYGSVVTLSYIAAERSQYGYNDMSDAKAMLESVVRNFGQVYGLYKKVRVNAISQSPTVTRAGTQFGELAYFYGYASDMSPLGLASADDCADLCVALFSDLTRKVTMQTIYNDGGFAHSLLTPNLIEDGREVAKFKNQTMSDEQILNK